MNEMVLVISRFVVGKDNLTFTVTLDPKPVGILRLKDIDVGPPPVRKAGERPGRHAVKVVFAGHCSGFASIGCPQTATRIVGTKQMPF